MGKKTRKQKRQCRHECKMKQHFSSVPTCDVTPEYIDVSVAIIGGGPHGLAALSALHEKSFSMPQYNDDATYSRRVGFDAFERVGKVCIVDPGSRFMEQWQRQFKALDIKHLRSPLFAHPDTYDEHALLNYAIQHGRTSEIKHVPLNDSKVINSTKFGLGAELFGSASTELFADFCSNLVDRLPHTWVQGTAVDVNRVSEGFYEIQYKVNSPFDGGDSCDVIKRIRAKAVIFALGPSGVPNIPPPYLQNENASRIVHTKDLFKAGGTLRESVAALTDGLRTKELQKPVLVIGGGLTAVQAAIAAHSTGASVVLRCRRPLRSRDYDISKEWLDRRYMNRKRFEFLGLSNCDRQGFVQDTVDGGSVPQSYLSEIEKLQATGTLCVEVQQDIDEATVATSKNGVVSVDQKEFSLVILATGVRISPIVSCSVLRKLNEHIPAEFVHNFPKLDESLRWAPGEDIFVMGAYATMQLGPGALNLMGAMRGAQLVGEELRTFMWRDKRTLRKEIETNMYALLEDDVCSESEGECDTGIGIPFTARPNYDRIETQKDVS